MFEIDAYKIVHNNNVQLLEETIKNLINEGWQPFGGLQMAGTSGSIFYGQAMVKYGQQQGE